MWNNLTALTPGIELNIWFTSLKLFVWLSRWYLPKYSCLCIKPLVHMHAIFCQRKLCTRGCLNTKTRYYLCFSQKLHSVRILNEKLIDFQQGLSGVFAFGMVFFWYCGRLIWFQVLLESIDQNIQNYTKQTNMIMRSNKRDQNGKTIYKIMEDIHHQKLKTNRRLSIRQLCKINSWHNNSIPRWRKKLKFWPVQLMEDKMVQFTFQHHNRCTLVHNYMVIKWLFSFIVFFYLFYWF